MKRYSPEDLLAYQVKILRGAEKQLAAALGRLSLQVDSSELFLALQTEAGRCFGRGQTLKQVSAALGRTCSPRSCDAILGMTEEARLIGSKSKPGSRILDAALVLLVGRALAYLEMVYTDSGSVASALGERAAALLSECRDLVAESRSQLRPLAESILEQDLHNDAAVEL